MPALEPQHAPQVAEPEVRTGPLDVPADPGFSQAPGPIPKVGPAGQPGPAQPSASELAFGDGPARPVPPTVRQGSTGPSVIELQTRLDRLGEALVLDGVFGPLTRAAVVRFQQSRGLDPDGVVGPLTWGALEATPAAAVDPAGTDSGDGDLLNRPGDGPPELGDLGGQGDEFSRGDAEENGDLPERTTAGGLETLDRGGGEVETTPGLDPAGGLFGFPGKAPVRTPVIHPQKAALIAGAFANRGSYADDGKGTGFVDKELDGLLEAYGAFWGIPDVIRQPAGPDATAVSAGAGDSAGKGVSTEPPWIKALTNKLMARTKFDDDDRATQRLIESFNRSFAVARGALTPGVEQLLHTVGGSETNGEAIALGGNKDGTNWCGPASHIGLLLGMYNRGIRFHNGGKHHDTYNKEIGSQVARYKEWTKQPGHVVSGGAAHNAPLQAGDIISVVNGGTVGPLGGHVATVVEQVGDRIIYVSGNAAGVNLGEGGVRIEEVRREQPPEGYKWDVLAARDNKFQPIEAREKKHEKQSKQKHAEMNQHLDAIARNLPAGAPSFDVNNPSSIAALIAFITAMPDSAEKTALLGHALEIARLSAEAAPIDAALAADRAADDAMHNDGDLPVNRRDSRFKLGVHAPTDLTTSWVVEVIQASKLTALQILGGQVSVEPNDPMLVKDNVTIKQQCKDAPADAVNPSAQ